MSNSELVQSSNQWLTLNGRSLALGSIGVSAGLASINLVSSKISIAFFLWEMTIPFLDFATSIPKKY